MNLSTPGSFPPPEENDRTPLLAGSERSLPSLHTRDTSPPNQNTRRQTDPAARLQRIVLTLVCISIVAVDFCNVLSYAPQLEIFESIICRQVPGHASTRDPVLGSPRSGNTASPCKSPEVQGELALLNGWKDTFDHLPGIVLALPYGLVADRIGRKVVLVLCITGLILEEVAIRLLCWWNKIVPLRAVLLTPAFQVLGGGPEIATSMAYSMITDVFLVDRRCVLSQKKISYRSCCFPLQSMRTLLLTIMICC